MTDIFSYAQGHVILGDCTDYRILNKITALCGNVPLIIMDPPYGNVMQEEWDNVGQDAYSYARSLQIATETYSPKLIPGGAMYVWGGIGQVGFRPFLKYLYNTEKPGEFELANLITWGKKRAHGVQNNYLFTREECAYWIKGNAKKPAKFNIPLLSEERGYPGYNAKYPAKSPFLRRTNVWSDVSEIFRGKKHPCEKPQRVLEIPIEVHTDPGDWVLDPFAGSGATAIACLKLNRKFILVEKDPETFNKIVQRLEGEKDV